MDIELKSTLTSAQELLLMKYHDGECSRLECWRVRRLLNAHPHAGTFLTELGRTGMCSDALSIHCPSGIDLWDRVERRIVQEECALALLSHKKVAGVKVPERKFFISPWIARLGWGVSGALVTASVGAIMIEPRSFNDRPGLTLASTGNTPRIVENAPLARTVSTMRSGLEADYLIGGGSVGIIDAPEGRSPLLWVNRSRKSDRSAALQKVVPVTQTLNAHSLSHLGAR